MAYVELVCDSTLPDASLVVSVAVPCMVTPTSLAACVAFYLSWSLLGLTRIIQWELPLMGGEFALVRYLACLPLPVIGAVTAVWLLRWRRLRPTSER